MSPVPLHCIVGWLAELQVPQDMMTFQYMALWIFVCGAALIWGGGFISADAMS